MPRLTLQPAPPKLRSDLVFSYQEMQGRPFYIIKDPVTGQFFRFREVECFIARQFDGETSLDTICKKAEQKFQASLDEESLGEFIDTLRGYGLLETNEGESESLTDKKPLVTRDDTPVDDFDIPGADRRTRVSGSLLYLRFKAFDPDRFFGWLAGKIRFFFTADFVAFSAVAITAGIVITIANWEAMRSDFSRLYSIQAWSLPG